MDTGPDPHFGSGHTCRTGTFRSSGRSTSVPTGTWRIDTSPPFKRGPHCPVSSPRCPVVSLLPTPPFKAEAERVDPVPAGLRERGGVRWGRSGSQEGLSSPPIHLVEGPSAVSEDLRPPESSVL